MKESVAMMPNLRLVDQFMGFSRSWSSAHHTENSFSGSAASSTIVLTLFAFGSALVASSSSPRRFGEAALELVSVMGSFSASGGGDSVTGDFMLIFDLSCSAVLEGKRCEVMSGVGNRAESGFSSTVQKRRSCSCI